MQEVPWEKQATPETPKTVYHMRSRPLVKPDGTVVEHRDQRILYTDDGKVKYVVEIEADKPISDSKDADVIEMFDGLIEIPPLRRLYQFEECLPY